MDHYKTWQLLKTVMISFTDKLLRAYLKKALHSKKELKISKYGGRQEANLAWRKWYLEL